MYIDEKILKILFRANGVEKEKEVLEEYNTEITNIIFEVVKKFITDPSFEKPNVKGFADIMKISDSSTKEEVEQTMMKAIATSLSFQGCTKLLNETILEYNRSLINGFIEDLEEEELDELIDYIEILSSNMEKNIQIFHKILEDLKNKQ